MTIVNCKDCHNENCRECGNYMRSTCWAFKEAPKHIKSIPAADVRPVVRGHWIDGACSNCGFFTDVVMSRFFSYCPNCGADMREQPKEEI